MVTRILLPVPEPAVTVLYTPDDGCDGQRGLIRPRWKKVLTQIQRSVPEATVTVLCTPGDGCDGHPKYVE